MGEPSAHHTPASTPRPTPNHAKPGTLQCSGRQYNLGDALPRNESMPLEHIAGLQVWKLRMLRRVIVKISGRDLPSGIERPKPQCAEEIYLFTDFSHGPLELQASPRPCPAFTPFARARLQLLDVANSRNEVTPLHRSNLRPIADVVCLAET